jgi:hypothetical protein
MSNEDYYLKQILEAIGSIETKINNAVGEIKKIRTSITEQTETLETRSR